MTGTVSVSTAARRTGYPSRTIRHWCALGRIPAHRPHDRAPWRVARAWVEAVRTEAEVVAIQGDNHARKSARSAKSATQRC